MTLGNPFIKNSFRFSKSVWIILQLSLLFSISLCQNYSPSFLSILWKLVSISSHLSLLQSFLFSLLDYKFPSDFIFLFSYQFLAVVFVLSSTNILSTSFSYFWEVSVSSSIISLSSCQSLLLLPLICSPQLSCLIEIPFISVNFPPIISYKYLFSLIPIRICFPESSLLVPISLNRVITWTASIIVKKSIWNSDEHLHNIFSFWLIHWFIGWRS